jgi:hypothetical protein
MKQLLTLVMALLMSLQISARPLDQAQLDQINAYIATLTQSSAPFEVNATLADVFIDEQTSLIRAAKLKTEIVGIATIDLGIETLQDQLIISASGSVQPLVIGMDDEAVQELVASLLGFVQMINDEGTYAAQVTTSDSVEGRALEVTLTPAGPNAHPSFREAKINAFLPASLENGDITIELTAQFDAQQDLIVTAQMTLTNIVNDLIKGQFPSDQDLETLQLLFQELIGTILF